MSKINIEAVLLFLLSYKDRGERYQWFVFFYINGAVINEEWLCESAFRNKTECDGASFLRILNPLFCFAGHISKARSFPGLKLFLGYFW